MGPAKSILPAIVPLPILKEMLILENPWLWPLNISQARQKYLQGTSVVQK